MFRARSKSFVWMFDSSPERVWQALADTARVNEAEGRPPYAVEERAEADGRVRFFGRARMGPFRLAWEELPAEWVEGQWFRQVRRFSSGPLARLVASVRLDPEGEGGAEGESGTRAEYTLEAAPTGPIGAALLATGFFAGAERSFGTIAASARDWAAGRRETPFDFAPAPVPDAVRRRLDDMAERVEASGNGHGLARRLADWLLTAPEVDAGRIRPLALARAWGVPERHAVEVCLQAVRDGMLEMRWDLLCPRCRGAKLSVPALDRLPRGAHCTSCNIAYDRDFARNVELAFTPAPAVRTVAEGAFCLLGPMSTPHVAAQITLEPGEARDLPARFAAGAWRVRSFEPGGQVDVDHDGGAFPSLTVADGRIAVGPPAPPGRLRLVNDGTARRTIVVESREWVRDALTAHRVTTMQAFRDLFPGTVLRAGDEVQVAQVTLMFTDLKGSTALYQRVGDASAWRLVHEHFAFLAQTVRRCDGAVVKTIGDAIMGAFPEPADAVRAALAIQAGVRDFNAASGQEAIVIKIGLHLGPCIAVTLNDRLDYFGSTVNMAARLQGASEGGDIVLSEALAADPAVRAILAGVPVVAETRVLKGFQGPVDFHRISGRAVG